MKAQEKSFEKEIDRQEIDIRSNLTALQRKFNSLQQEIQVVANEILRLEGELRVVIRIKKAMQEAKTEKPKEVQK